MLKLMANLIIFRENKWFHMAYHSGAVVAVSNKTTKLHRQKHFHTYTLEWLVFGDFCENYAGTWTMMPNDSPYLTGPEQFESS